jgi:hypothetical protein
MDITQAAARLRRITVLIRVVTRRSLSAPVSIELTPSREDASLRGRTVSVSCSTSDERFLLDF